MSAFLISTGVSILALTTSALTAWLTLFQRGTVKMTQPTIIFFGPDGSRSSKDRPAPKIFLRTLLFSTAKRGRVIESMHVSLTRNESHQNFSIWVYGEEKLARGSGLFVGDTGISANHHFLAPRDGNNFEFREGRYRLRVYARLLGSSHQTLLFTQELEISANLAESLSKPSMGVYFDWGPDSSSYIPHLEEHPPVLDPQEFIKALISPAPITKAL